MYRAITASKANRENGPTLSIHSSREALIAWLQWCDPNGCHTDELAAIEDMDPYTLETAWEAVRDMLKDNE